MTQFQKTLFWSLLRLFVVIIWVIHFLGCATRTHGFGDRAHFRPDNVRAWSIGCRENAVNRAREIMLEGKGNPGAALYYLRCRDLPEYLIELRAIKNRRWWLEPDVKHHPEPVK